ncbi:class I SAM-dependent methyltransferase [Thiolinea disciformis]|uniref:class I SAM-dependent methyltransferase n=1 Tax=Thiolinea disciformis TaxID=125614 RepID=UPI000375CB59|nr:class I SAM-dependent methyltransferase [Thiolinea disciformis]
MSNEKLLKRALLDEIAIRYGTDKSSKQHDYMRFYEFYFSSFRDQEFTFLELGVGPEDNKGKSLYTWSEYFKNAQVVGVDIRPDAKTIEHDRIIVEIGNLSSLNYLQTLARKFNQNRIILDDASHMWSHQILAFEVLFQTLESGGLYIVEDLHTSFRSLHEQSYADSPVDAFTYFNHLTYCICGRGAQHRNGEKLTLSAMQIALAQQIDMIAFYGKTLLIIKK